jgi:ABC-type glycerol-3-phosphate transport system substrate-binding protein
MAIAGNVPDMYASDAVNTVKMAALNIPLELRAALGQDYIDGFAKENVGEMTIGGKIYSAPWFSIPTAILYRTDLFAKAGVKPPKSSLQYVRHLQKILMEMERSISMDGQWLELIMVLVKVDSTQLPATWVQLMSARIHPVSG